MHRFLMPAVVVAMLLSPVLAINCSPFGGVDHDLCVQINTMNITESDKQALLTLAFYTDRTVPNHDFVAFWNQHLNISEAPQSVATHSRGTIRDAWATVVSVMPSILENDTLSCPSQGTLQSAYDYHIELPTDIRSGDCFTEYLLHADRTTFTQFANTNSLGSNRIASFNLPDGTAVVNFTAQLALAVDTEVRHSQTRRVCCRYSGRTCTRYCNQCNYIYSDIETDSLIVQDSRMVDVDQKEPRANLVVTNSYAEQTQGTVAFSNLTRWALTIGNSSYARSDYLYDFAYSLPPYSVLTLKTSPFVKQETSSLIVDSLNDTSFFFTARTSDHCSLSVATHFRSIVIPCWLKHQSVNVSIETDKFYYRPNDTIHVYVEPTTLPITVTYSNQSQIIIGNGSFRAVYPDNKISATSGSEQAATFVSVIGSERLRIMWQLLVFCFIMYALFTFVTRSSTRKWLIVD